MRGTAKRREFIGALGAVGLAGTYVLPARGSSPDGTSPAVQSAAAPTTSWEETYGSPLDDYAEAIIPTSDGNYVFCGTSEYQYGAGKAWLVQVAPDGSARWERTYGEAAEANDVVEAPDGGYVFAGVRGTDSGEDGWLVKVADDGSEQWATTFGGTGHDRARGLTTTSDGGYVLAGGKRTGGNEEAWLVKVDGDGTKQWERTFGDSGDDWGNDVIATSDGGYLLAGRKTVDGPQKALLAKVGADGRDQWTRTFGGDGDAGAASVIETTDGRYVFSGKTRPGMSYVGWLVRVGSDGAEHDVWTFGTDLDDTAEALRETADGGFLFEGATEVEEGGIEDLWLGKLSPDGEVQWTQTYGTPGDDYSLSFTQTHDDGFLLLGNSDASGTDSAWLVKLEAPGLSTATPTETATPTRSPPPTTVAATAPADSTVAGTATPRSSSGTVQGTPQASTPGFGFLAAIAGLAGAGYLGWRRTKD